MTERPTAGWYPDPSSQAPYRWWDGDRWSTRTSTHRQDDTAPTAAPAAIAATATAAAPAPAGAAVSATAAGTAVSALLPSRRSLRQAGSTPTIDAPTDLGPMHASQHADVRPAEPATRQPADEYTVPLDPQRYIPLNPLRVAAPQSPQAAAPDWHAPDAWVANSPHASLDDHAVYGTGTPFVATLPAGHKPTGVNPFANLGAGFALIGLLYQAVVAVWGAPLATSWTGVAVAVAVLAGLLLGVLGVARAHLFVAEGAPARRSEGVLVILVCLLALGAQALVATGSGLSDLADLGGLLP